MEYTILQQTGYFPSPPRLCSRYLKAHRGTIMRQSFTYPRSSRTFKRAHGKTWPRAHQKSRWQALKQATRSGYPLALVVEDPLESLALAPRLNDHHRRLARLRDLSFPPLSFAHEHVHSGYP